MQEHYCKGSGLHRHHIVPKHSNGSDDEDNITYLTVREHKIAHFLLWKMHGNALDLGAMWMLSGKLSPQKRKELGDWCYSNQIGVHSDKYKNDKEANSERCKKSSATQKLNQVGTFSPEGRKLLASKGGSVGGKSQYINKIGIHHPDNVLKNASLGGKAIKGMICVTNGRHRTRIKPERLTEYLKLGYVKGFTLFDET